MPTLPRCPELDCVRHLLSPGATAFAEVRAAEADVGADRVLVTHGLIDEATYAAALAHYLGCAFEPLDRVARASCPLSDDQIIDSARTGLLRLTTQDGDKLVVALRENTARTLMRLHTERSDLPFRIALTGNAYLSRFVADQTRHTIGFRAAEQLREHRPELSAGNEHGRSIVTIVIVAVIALLALIAPADAALGIDLVLGLIFLAWTGLRLLSTVSPNPAPQARPESLDRDLPIYTLVIALYREATAVDGLIAAIRTLNYPLERLDIKIVLEPDDHDTRAAIERLGLLPPFETIFAPDNAPRTKPKALNAALPFSRGKFIAIYDAEDRPEPGQLRLALEAFTAGDDSLACVQARLTIDNTSDSWLTRLFTAEYAGLFDVFLPGLAQWHMPLPLGGSSNHFRTEILQKVGGWDPYNVTEDADLGMRLARLGYRSTVIQSTTYEEAPARFRPWLRQRTRWCKGWMQTWLVHMRSPRQLRRDLGTLGFIIFQLLVGGTVMASLVHSLFVAKLLTELVLAGSDPDTLVAMTSHAIFLAAGYVAFIGVCLVGLFRRKLLRCAWALILLPIYWMLLSLAAWRALFQLVRDPYRWEKTEHGLARTSRLAQQWEPAVTDNFAVPRQPRPAAASD